MMLARLMGVFSGATVVAVGAGLYWSGALFMLIALVLFGFELRFWTLRAVEQVTKENTDDS